MGDRFRRRLLLGRRDGSLEHDRDLRAALVREAEREALQCLLRRLEVLVPGADLDPATTVFVCAFVSTLMLLASTRPSAIRADFTSTVLAPAAVFSATFSVSCFTPRTVLAHAPLNAATTIKAHTLVECLLTMFLLRTLIARSYCTRGAMCTAEALR